MPSTSKHLQLQLFARLSSCSIYGGPSLLCLSTLDAYVPPDSSQASKTLRGALTPTRHRYVAHPRPPADLGDASSLVPGTAQRAKRYENSAAKETGGPHA